MPTTIEDLQHIIEQAAQIVKAAPESIEERRNKGFEMLKEFDGGPYRDSVYR